MRNKLLLLAVMSLFLISLVSADPYSDCTRYGNCKPVNPSVVFNNNTATVNSTVYWLGMNGLQAPWIIKTSTFLDFNGTKLNNEFVRYSNFSTFNSTYDNFWLSNDTIWSAINNRIQLNNATINAGIPFWYNYTTIDLANDTATYVPYNGALGNVDLGINNITTRTIYVNSSILGISVEASNFTVSSLGAFGFGFMGSSNLSRNYTTTIIANNRGSFAQGEIFAGTSGTNSTGIISSTNFGSFAQGRVNLFTGSNSVSAITSSGVGSFAQGGVQGSSNSSPILIASGNGAFAQGQIISNRNNPNSRQNITASGVGSFAQGYVNAIGSVGIVASGNGAFAHGIITETNSSIIASGVGSVAIGQPNISVSGTGSIGLGKNINITGSNTLAFGVGGVINTILASNQFWTNALSNLTGDAITPRLNVTNVTVDQLFNIKFTTLPTCNVASNGSVGRNLTGLYDCRNGNGTWVLL